MKKQSKVLSKLLLMQKCLARNNVLPSVPGHFSGVFYNLIVPERNINQNSRIQNFVLRVFPHNNATYDKKRVILNIYYSLLLPSWLGMNKSINCEIVGFLLFHTDDNYFDLCYRPSWKN